MVRTHRGTSIPDKSVCENTTSTTSLVKSEPKKTSSPRPNQNVRSSIWESLESFISNSDVAGAAESLNENEIMSLGETTNSMEETSLENFPSANDGVRNMIAGKFVDDCRFPKEKVEASQPSPIITSEYQVIYSPKKETQNHILVILRK